jgi:hypothetical protein
LCLRRLTEPRYGIVKLTRLDAELRSPEASTVSTM